MAITASTSVRELVRRAAFDARLDLSPEDAGRMIEGVRVLSEQLLAGERVYGITQGFGPLVTFGASLASAEQGTGLISHLGTGQGAPLPPDVTRLMVRLRLDGMRLGHSAVSPERWTRLAQLWNAGFTPVVPREGTLSASGDLTPLAHAALAFAGMGESWVGSTESGWGRVGASEALSALGVSPIAWEARDALAFVNGTSASLARTCHNHVAVHTMARAVAALTGRIAWLLGANDEAYSDEVARVRGHAGHARAASWIRAELRSSDRKDGRPLQEPYSLRCAPQVIGAVIDQLDAQATILLNEASGCTDNPVVVDGQVFHGGNFHAMPTGFSSDVLLLCVHQLAFMAERQLWLLLDERTNGGLPPMLTPRPGACSGLAGVQLTASSLVSRIRQLGYPATLTALPSNLGNQDHVPMTMNGANAAADCIDLAWLVIGSLVVAVDQLTFLQGSTNGRDDMWMERRRSFTPVVSDRPLAADVRAAAAWACSTAERILRDDA